MMDFFFFGGAFQIIFFIFFLMFFLILGMFIAVFVKGIGEWNKNNHSPRLIVEATVTAKRNHVSHHHNNHGTGVSHSSSSTSYYVAFEVETGDRMELRVSGSEFGLLVEGDYGKLTFQGTRYLGFERIR